MTAGQTPITDLERQIGPRSKTTGINSANRTLVRKWLTANGVASKTARSLSLAQLREAYQDWTDHTLTELQLGQMPGESERAPERDLSQRTREAFRESGDDDDDDDDDGDDAEPNPLSREPNPLNQPQQQEADPMQQGNPDQVQQIAQMLAGMMGSGQGVDRDQVREIVRELGPELVEQHGIRTVELVRPDGAQRVEGAHPALEEVTQTINAGCHVWLPGPAGSGKTTLARQTAEALDLDFYGTGAVHSVYALIGYKDATGTYQTTPFREAFEHGGVFLFDEVDGSNPAALTAVNQAIDNGEFAFPDGMVKRHPQFRCIAAANTYGHGATSSYVGRIKQDGAVLDRFVFLPIGYSETVEKQLAGEYQDWHREVCKARQKVADLGIQHIISPRATRDGARMLAAGVSVETVREATIRKGLDQASWDRVKEAL